MVGMKNVLGHAAAAEENHKHKTRDGVLQTLVRLGIPQRQWPNSVLAHYKGSSHRHLFRQIIDLAFQPPPFDRLNESPEEWKKKADADWERRRDRFLAANEYRSTQGIDGRIAPTKRSRGPGKTQKARKRKNTAIEYRYEWAARRLCGEQWKEIAFKYQIKESTVIKAASEVLRTAGWPTKP